MTPPKKHPEAGQDWCYDDRVSQLAQQLLKSGFDHFSERERRVITAIASRHHITSDVNQTLFENSTLMHETPEMLCV